VFIIVNTTTVYWHFISRSSYMKNNSVKDLYYICYRKSNNKLYQKH